jgi:hypothetical protein
VEAGPRYTATAYVRVQGSGFRIQGPEVGGQGSGVRDRESANSPHPSPLPKGEGTRQDSPHPSPLPKGEGTRQDSPHPNPLPKGEGTRQDSPHPNPLPKGEGTRQDSPHPNPLPKGEGTRQDIPHTNPLPREEGTIVFTQSGDDSKGIAELANAQAERYVSERRAEWRKSCEVVCGQARSRAEAARQAHVAEAARLDAFEQQIRETEAMGTVAGLPGSAENTVGANRATRSPAASKARSPAMIDNPQWLELQRQIAALDKRRERLLVDRTPLHPAVQAVDDKIADLRSELAVTPRQVPDPKAVAAPEEKENPSAEAARKSMAAAAEKNRRKKAELVAAVETARRVRTEAELSERRAEQQLRAVPQLDIRHAEVVENLVPVDWGWRRMFWTSISAGIFMAFGAGAMLWGRSIESPVLSIAEVQAALGEPIVGIIPAKDPLPAYAAVCRQKRMRRVAILLGVMLILICPAVAIWGVMGI